MTAYGVILAAGLGTRMRSAVPKVLHTVCGRPMLDYVLDAVTGAGGGRPVVVVGHGSAQVREQVNLNGWRPVWVVQSRPRGSGHALSLALRALGVRSGTALVVCGDTPLIRQTTLSAVVRAQIAEEAAATILTARVEHPAGYGRIVRGHDGGIERIVEERDATPGERAIREVNAGVYGLRLGRVLPLLGRLRPENAKREYYLTDLVHLLRQMGERVGSVRMDGEEEILGINTRRELARAEQIMRRRILERHLLAGVTIRDPESCYVDAGVTLGPDTTLLPGTILQGKTSAGRGCCLGPYAVIRDSRLGDGVEVRASFLDGVVVEAGSRIGPYAHLRPGTRIGRNVKIGNFTEFKASRVGDGTRVSHLSYVGDSTLGRRVNVGAGTITCNYDGKRKHPTWVGDGAFIGSNVSLVAPVRVGRRAVIGAGSTITESVPAEALAVARARQVNKPGWARRRG